MKEAIPFPCCYGTPVINSSYKRDISSEAESVKNKKYLAW
jgi:hypothetical protein